MVSCPSCATPLFTAPNAALARLRTLRRELLDGRRDPGTLVFYVDPQTEHELLGVSAVEVGAQVAHDLHNRGVRVAFAYIYGHRTVWDAPHLDLRPEEM